MTAISGIVVIAFGLCLTGFALVMVFRPSRAEGVLKLFASSAKAHFTEQCARLAVGVALLVFSGEMRYSNLFRVLGWLMVATAVALMLLPWRWHQKFGSWTIPFAIRHIRLYAAAVLALGALILYATSGYFFRG